MASVWEIVDPGFVQLETLDDPPESRGDFWDDVQEPDRGFSKLCEVETRPCDIAHWGAEASVAQKALQGVREDWEARTHLWGSRTAQRVVVA